MKNTIGEYFWFVTKPTPESNVEDICFSSAVSGIIMQAKGGLMPSDMVGMFKSRGPAARLAEQLIAEVRNVK